ncbi:MAG: lysophospholipid acyltransferase family protein [Steroidobacteraceae bacterium]
MISALGKLPRVLYGLYVWALFVVLSLLTLILVLLVPPLTVRRAIARQVSALFLLLAGMPVRVLNDNRLPDHPCVVVANHSSYLDGVILKAALPAHFCFVIKKEMVRVPLAGALLRRIGSEFVDRFNRHSGGMDARRIIRTASGGQSLAFFPEGTFTEQPGLARFHIGAFIIAVRASMPVVPVAIRGARRGLPADSIWPRPGRIEVEVLGLLPLGKEQADSSAAAARLRDAAREQILAAVDEPDLEQEPPPPATPD